MRVIRSMEVRRRPRSVSLAIASAAFFFVLPGGMQSFAQPTQNATTSNISGTVINSVTHEPIGHALVYSADGVYATFTDDHGHFELSLPEMRVGATSSSSSTVIVSSFGGQSSVDGSYLQAKRPGFLASPVTPIPSGTAPSREEVTLSLIPEGLIVGKVKVPHGGVCRSRTGAALSP